MRWQGRQSSSNVDDRRRGGTAKKVGGGIGIGTILLVILALIMGENPLQFLNLAQGGGTATQGPTKELSAEDKARGEFVSVVLKETEDVWNELFPKQLNRRYAEPKLVLFSGEDRSACGYASAATGPFYCPADQTVYIDLSFYETLQKRFGAKSGDFALAYVIGHEVGHHVQNLLGYTSKVSRQRGRVPEAQYNDLSVRLELMADFLAGVWAHHMEKNNKILEEGDFEEAMSAAHAVGDDNIQKRSRGYVVPESFTHGTSEQRMRWFRKGFVTGDLSQGDTFSAKEL